MRATRGSTRSRAQRAPPGAAAAPTCVVDLGHRQVQVLVEGVHHALALLVPQQAVVHKHAMQAVAQHLRAAAGSGGERRPRCAAPHRRRVRADNAGCESPYSARLLPDTRRAHRAAAWEHVSTAAWGEVPALHGSVHPCTYATLDARQEWHRCLPSAASPGAPAWQQRWSPRLPTGRKSRGRWGRPAAAGAAGAAVRAGREHSAHSGNPRRIAFNSNRTSCGRKILSRPRAQAPT